MFEQTLLTHPRATQKTGALFVSLLAQILICGVLLITPLIFTDALPALRMARIDSFVPPQPPAPEPPVMEAVTQTTASRQFNPLTTIRAPISIPQRLVPNTLEAVAPIPPVAVANPDLFPGIAVAVPIVIPAPPPPTPVAVEPNPAPLAPPLQVSGGAQLAKLIKRVVPAYPALARQIRVSGTVRLLGIIAKDGRIRELKVLSGHPMLRQSALDAVSQWVYSPTILSGQPVEVEAPIDVIFEFR